MLITLSGLADETALYSMQRSTPSKDNDKVSIKAVFVCLNGLSVFIDLCFAPNTVTEF